ncbi:hypothetical protein ACIPPM_13655 [Streptomyces sp. NPDC090119]|uniref:hypothetical protein n=1 Tax=Streptomyces sp. NPDC090119 TaxID=3365951 RepID=UPI0037FE93D9
MMSALSRAPRERGSWFWALEREPPRGAPLGGVVDFDVLGTGTWFDAEGRPRTGTPPEPGEPTCFGAATVDGPAEPEADASGRGPDLTDRLSLSGDAR